MKGLKENTEAREKNRIGQYLPPEKVKCIVLPVNLNLPIAQVAGKLQAKMCFCHNEGQTPKDHCVEDPQQKKKRNAQSNSGGN